MWSSIPGVMRAICHLGLQQVTAWHKVAEKLCDTSFMNGCPPSGHRLRSRRRVKTTEWFNSALCLVVTNSGLSGFHWVTFFLFAPLKCFVALFHSWHSAHTVHDKAFCYLKGEVTLKTVTITVRSYIFWRTFWLVWITGKFFMNFFLLWLFYWETQTCLENDFISLPTIIAARVLLDLLCPKAVWTFVNLRIKANTFMVFKSSLSVDSFAHIGRWNSDHVDDLENIQWTLQPLKKCSGHSCADCQHALYRIKNEPTVILDYILQKKNKKKNNWDS